MDSNFTRITESIFAMFPSGVASIGARGQSAPLTAKKLSKIGKKRKNWETNEKKRKNWEEKAKIGKVLSLSPLDK